MLKLARYIKKYTGVILLILVLLVIQANCDLSLPGYTSDIVNVGIQQNGIEDAVADTLSSGAMEKLFLFMDPDEQELIKASYTEKDGIWSLDKTSKKTRKELNRVLGKPMVAAYAMSSGSEELGLGGGAAMQLPEGKDPFDALKHLPEEQLATIKDKLYEKLDQMPDTLITQGSIAFVKADYQEQGIDLDAFQKHYLLMAGLKMLAFAFLIMLISIAVTFLSCRLAAGTAKTLRDGVFTKVVSFSNREFEKFSTASLITRSTNDIQQVQMVLTLFFRMVLYAPILGIGGVIHALETSRSMAWVILLAVVLVLGVVAVLFAITLPRFKKLQDLIDRLNLVTREILQGLPVIRAFSREKQEEQRFDKANKDFISTNLFVNRCMTFMMPAMMLVMNEITVLIVWTGSKGIDAGTMQVGDMMAYIQYTMMIIMSFLMITMMSIMLPRASVSAGRINEILETEVILQDPEREEKADAEKKGVVEFRHVSFAYPGAADPVLQDIDFTARPGETTAIIGSTGCGKSTLVNLIPRFYDVTEGEILVDGVDVRKMKQHTLHEKLGYVPQKGVLFSGTIASNIAYSKDTMGENDIHKAAEIAQASDFIEEKEEQYDSPIAQGGTNVSGGQKQRLSIARAIAGKPEIYIFDDSFSALDYKTDAALRKALKEETAQATTIIVAQRISTILHAEQIIVLDEGRIAGIGTHKELLKSCEVYHQIAASQLSKEELDHE